MQSTDYRWVIVAAGSLVGCVAMGCLFALPVFLVNVAEDTGWSRTGISAAMTIAFLVMGFAGVFWGAMSDKYGPRIVCLAGTALLVCAMLLTSITTSLILFQITFGALMGISIAAFFAPLMATVTGWFDTQRSLAVSLISAGMGLAPVTMSPLAGWLITAHSWRGSLMIMAAIAALVMVPACLLLRRPPALATAQDGAQPVAASSSESVTNRRQAFLSAPFIVLFATNFFCCATHSGPIFHTVSYAISCGIAPLLAVTIYSIEGLAGMPGRIVFGLAGDRFGAKWVLVVGLLVQAFGALGYFFAHDLAAFYGTAAVFGFIYAGVMPLYSVLLRENFPLHILGTLMGGLGLAGGLGMATGPVLGGWIFDTTGNYGWLYLSSFGMGLGAFLIAMLFRPFPNVTPVQTAAA
ncbi:MAG: MFS transporter [Hyphomicrobiales bacterium]